MTTRLAAPPLDVATIMRLIAAQFPALSPRALVLIGEGCDFRAYLVDDRWVFRFPRSAEGAAYLRPEIAVLSALAPDLPLPVPDYRFVGTPCAKFAYPFAGYAKLPGVPAMRLPVSEGARDAAAESLGVFLTALHRQDTARAAAVGVPGRSSGIRMTEMRDEAAARLDAVGSLLDREIERRCRRFFDDPMRLPADSGGPDRLIHADLTAEHVLLDPAGGAITGIIDWTDMRTDDIAFDFAGLWHWQGDRGVDIALRHYGGRADPRMRDRARYIGLWKALEDIRYGHETEDPGRIAFSVRCLERAFGA
jgi:aminoglycoside phosphotransferase (APT) family kinase protein